MLKPLNTAHPWHGIDHPEGFPLFVNAFIEIVPDDSVKFEVDKKSGILKIDRPQKYSNFLPALYGFIPKTYCSKNVAKFAMQLDLNGDKDPLDICVITERSIKTGGIIAQTKIIGGFRLIDKNEVDDKIIGVLKDDAVFGQYNELSELPVNLIERLRHYFLTYKNLPDQKSTVVIEKNYDKNEALQVINASVIDYNEM